MSFNDDAGAGTEDALDEPQLPRHLAALVGALQGPADLGVHHDRYLTYPHHEQSDGAIIA
ncbi:hypothetical protein [Sphaerisporangium dianthi]|uniref:Uncharacterized protein n=1 Tax=Sphaerisporangium dianthi TaxID=1436120 RepID=A0ABV9CKL9_9ACTN